MNDHLDPTHFPAEHDPVLDRHLVSLGHLSPAPGFEDRVMASVSLPSPVWALRLREWRRVLIRTRRGQAFLGGLAAASVISVTFAGTWAFANPELVATVLGWVAAKTWLPVWQTSMRFVASFISTFAYTLSSLVAPTGLIVGSIVGVVTLATSALGLRRLMARPGVTRNLSA